MKAQRGRRGIALLFFTLPPDEGGWLTPRPGRFIIESNLVPIVPGWAPGPVWQGAENFVFTGILSPDRPFRSYIDCDVPSSEIRYNNYLSKLIGKDEFCKIASVPVLLY
jgi:hypothetical protein